MKAIVGALSSSLHRLPRRKGCFVDVGSSKNKNESKCHDWNGIDLRFEQTKKFEGVAVTDYGNITLLDVIPPNSNAG